MSALVFEAHATARYFRLALDDQHASQRHPDAGGGAQDHGCGALQPAADARRSAWPDNKRENGSEIPAFWAFDFVSGLPVRRS